MYRCVAADRGQVVGVARAMAGEDHAVLWDGGEFHDLGTLGGAYSSARAINERGQIVGASRTDFGPIHAFLWEPHS